MLSGEQTPGKRPIEASNTAPADHKHQLTAGADGLLHP
jgi:hypothetical protein